MQYGIREVRRQERVRGKVKCFRYRENGHKKWECLRRREKRREEVAPHEMYRRK